MPRQVPQRVIRPLRDAHITITEDPAQPVAGVGFIHTDVWVSMGKSQDVWTERARLLAPDQVNASLMRKTPEPRAVLAACWSMPRTGAADGFAGVAVLGLAPVVLALLALEELGSPTAGRAAAVITVTVLLSVAHGATAEPLAARYAKLLSHRGAGGPGAPLPDMPDRRLIRRNSPPHG